MDDPIIPIGATGVLDNITVTTADGRVFNLGRPSSRLFKLRVALYKWRRRHEKEG